MNVFSFSIEKETNKVDKDSNEDIIKISYCFVFVFRDNNISVMTLWVQSTLFVFTGFWIIIKKVLRGR